MLYTPTHPQWSNNNTWSDYGHNWHFVNKHFNQPGMNDQVSSMWDAVVMEYWRNEPTAAVPACLEQCIPYGNGSHVYNIYNKFGSQKMFILVTKSIFRQTKMSIQGTQKKPCHICTFYFARENSLTIRRQLKSDPAFNSNLDQRCYEIIYFCNMTCF